MNKNNVTQESVNISRRSFVEKSATAAAVFTIAPGVVLNQVHAKPAAEPVSDAKRWGILIDAAKCGHGCNDCVTACNEEHNIVSYGRPLTDQKWIRKIKLKDNLTNHIVSLPMLCQHCEKPPCVDVCPTGASFKRADGIVLVDRHICIGCRYCMMACPYKARSFAHEAVDNKVEFQPRGKGTVESCTMCVHRVDNDRIPACVEACSSALIFGDLKDPQSEISMQLEKHGGKQIRADLGLNTGVRYRGI